MALPPIHRFDHVPVFVSASDDAWDTDRIEAEQANIEAANADPSIPRLGPWPSVADHPMVRYESGESRYDISTVQAYLRPEANPVRAVLRRLKGPHWQQVDHLLSTGQVVAARNYALRFGLAEVTGLEHAFAFEVGEAELFDRLRSQLGDAFASTVGYAVISVSRELLSAEKKP